MSESSSSNDDERVELDPNLITTRLELGLGVGTFERVLFMLGLLGIIVIGLLKGVGCG